MSDLAQLHETLTRAAEEIYDRTDGPLGFLPSVASIFMLHVEAECPEDYNHHEDVGLHFAVRAARAYLKEIGR